MQKEKENNKFVREVADEKYKYGFTTQVDTDIIPKGLNEDVIRLISAKKQEPDWLLQFRLDAYRYWLTLEMPRWAHLYIPDIDFQDISYYAESKSLGNLKAQSNHHYAKEYGTDTIQIHKDAIAPDDVVLLHDDLLATGGTMAAAYRLVKKCGVEKAYINFVIELNALNGRKAFPENVEIETLLQL